MRRARTNTPLQALTLLNDETFVEAARALAQNALRKQTTPESAVSFAFKSVLGRDPSSSEKSLLAKGFQRSLAKYKANPAEAEALLKNGVYPRDPKLSPFETAAMTVVCSTILNLDEAVTKE